MTNLIIQGFEVFIQQRRVAQDVTHALGQVAGELSGVAQTMLDATAKAYEHDVFHDLGEVDARSGVPDRHFDLIVPRDDVVAYETGRNEGVEPR